MYSEGLRAPAPDLDSLAGADNMQYILNWAK